MRVQLEVPTELLSSVQLAALHMNRQPRFVQVKDGEDSMKLMDDSTGVIQRRLSNGIRVNYKVLFSPETLLLSFSVLYIPSRPQCGKCCILSVKVFFMVNRVQYFLLYAC